MAKGRKVHRDGPRRPIGQELKTGSADLPQKQADRPGVLSMWINNA
jgi:hypothetical protein